MSWLSKEWKDLEAAGIRAFVNGVIVPNEAKLQTLVPEAGTGADAVVALIEQDDAKVLGPFVSEGLNVLLNSYKTEIDAEVATLAETGVSGVPALAQALLNIAAKLESEQG
jgi:hypothetical protein